MPGHTEALLVARNQDGNHGTLAFTLGSTGLQLIIMWTSGLNCDHYANTLAVGITNSPNSDKFRCTVVQHLYASNNLQHIFSAAKCTSSHRRGSAR